MKAKLYPYFFFSLCFCQAFSQKLADLHLINVDGMQTKQSKVNLNYSEEATVNNLSLLNIRGDLYTIQVINYAINDLSISVNTRVEEELPYETNTYDYKAFYYLDFGCSYNLGDFNVNLSLENIFNFNSKEFSIDPNLVTSNNITNAFYFSHEADALATFAVAYNF